MRSNMIQDAKLDKLDKTDKTDKLQKLDKLMGFYKNIREALLGLSEIIDINFPKWELFHKAGMDNLQSIHNEILAILETSDPQEFKMRLRDLEFDETEIEKNFPF